MVRHDWFRTVSEGCRELTSISVHWDCLMYLLVLDLLSRWQRTYIVLVCAVQSAEQYEQPDYKLA